MPREDFNELNEAIIGMQRNQYTLKDLNEEEFKEFIKYLLLLSGSGSATVCESYITKTLADHNIGVTNEQLQNLDFNQLLLECESLNEGDFMDAGSQALTVGAATGVAAVGGLAAYISFLFKKKKIRKASEAVRDAKIKKIDIEKEVYDELEAMKPILTKEEGDAKIKEIEEKAKKDKDDLKNFEKNKKEEAEKVAAEVDVEKLQLKDLGADGYESYESPKPKKNPTPTPAPGATGSAGQTGQAGGTGQTEVKTEDINKESLPGADEATVKTLQSGTPDEKIAATGKLKTSSDEKIKEQTAALEAAKAKKPPDTAAAEKAEKEIQAQQKQKELAEKIEAKAEADKEKADEAKAIDAQIKTAKAAFDKVKDGDDAEAAYKAEIKFKQAQQKKAKLDGNNELFQGLGDDIGKIMKLMNTQNSSLDPLAEADETTNKDKDKTNDKGDKGEPFGKLGVAKADLKAIQGKEEEEVRKAKEKIAQERGKIEKNIKKLKEKSSDEKTLKKVEKLGKDKKKLSDEIEKLEKEGTGKVKTAREKVAKIKGDIETKLAKVAKLEEDNKKANDETTIKAEKVKLQKEIDKTEEKIEKVKEDMQPTGTAKEKEAIEAKATAKKEKVGEDVAAAQKELDRMSGTSTDKETGKKKSDSLIGKMTGFEKNYVKQIGGEHELEVLQHKEEVMNQIGNEKAAAAAAAGTKGAEARAEAGEDGVKAEKDKTDATPAEMEEVDDKVAAAKKEEEARKAEEAKEKKEKKKQGLQKQIEALQKQLEKVKADKKDFTPKDPKEKEQKEKVFQHKIDKISDNLTKAKEHLAAVGESFGLKLEVAMLISEFNSLLEEYDLVLEDRKELKEEEKEKKKDDVKPDDEKLDLPADAEPPAEKKEKKKEDKHKLIDQKVVIIDMIGSDESHLEGAKGVITHAWKENERAPEGDMPRRSGDPELFTITFDKPKDPMYPEINLTQKNFKEDKEDKKDDDKSTNESFREKYYKAVNG